MQILEELSRDESISISLLACAMLDIQSTPENVRWWICTWFKDYEINQVPECNIGAENWR